MNKILVTVLAAMTAAAHAEPVTVYGLTLGQPLGLQKCAPGARTVVCYSRMSRNPVELVDENLIVDFPAGQAPEMASGGNVAAWVVDGKVQRVTWWTTGVTLQQEHLAKLEAKFGPAGLVERKRAVTRFGVEFPVIEATWGLPDGVVVTFTGAFDRADRGRVEVSTPEGLAAFRRGMDAINARSSGTKL